MKVLHNRKMQTARVCQKKNLSQTGCAGLEGGPVEIIFILKVEVSGLSDHNKHGQPGFRLWLR